MQILMQMIMFWTVSMMVMHTRLCLNCIPNKKYFQMLAIAVATVPYFFICFDLYLRLFTSQTNGLL